MAKIPDELIAEERRLLARALANAAQPAPTEPRRRKLKGLRKVSQVIERTWVSAGCHGEAVQWRLKSRTP